MPAAGDLQCTRSPSGPEKAGRHTCRRQCCRARCVFFFDSPAQRDHAKRCSGGRHRLHSLPPVPECSFEAGPAAGLSCCGRREGLRSLWSGVSPGRWTCRCGGGLPSCVSLGPVWTSTCCCLHSHPDCRSVFGHQPLAQRGALRCRFKAGVAQRRWCPCRRLRLRLRLRTPHRSLPPDWSLLCGPTRPTPGADGPRPWRACRAVPLELACLRVSRRGRQPRRGPPGCRRCGASRVLSAVA